MTREREPGNMHAKTDKARGARRRLTRLIALGVTVGALAATATPALAAFAPRTYDSQITGFGKPGGVYVDNTADDSVWISDVGKGSVLSHYDAYPSQTKIGEQNGGGRWGGGNQVHGPSVNDSNGFLYAAVPGGQFNFNIFDNFGDFYGQMQGAQESSEFNTAVDNSTGTSRGRVYLYGDSFIQVFDGYGNPVNFSGSASYIVGNKITGSPFGNISQFGGGNQQSDIRSGIAVDSHGNIWITDVNGYEPESRGIYEFAPSGVFIRRITAASSGVPSNPNTPAASTPGWGGDFAGFGGIAIDPTNEDILVSDRANLWIDEFSPAGEYIGHIDAADSPAGGLGFQCFGGLNPPASTYCYDFAIGLAVNSQGYLYVNDGTHGVVDIYSPHPPMETVAYKPETNPAATSITLNAEVDPNGTPDISSCHFDYVANADYNPDSSNPYGSGPSHGTATCVPDPSGSNFTGPTDVHADILGLTAETRYHYRLVIANAEGTVAGTDRAFTPHTVTALHADPATSITPTGATLNGSFIGDGSLTHYYFEWGTTTSYNHQSAIPPGDSAGSPGVGVLASESFAIGGLEPASIYHFRIVAANGSGTSSSDDQSFKTAPVLPQVRESVSAVHSNGVRFNTEVNPGGADTTYHFEFGTSPCSNLPNPCSSTPTSEAHIGSNSVYDSQSRIYEGLTPNTTYYYRVVATNQVGSVPGPDKVFATQPFNDTLNDVCSNKLARQQTGAIQLLDCRAYELASAAHAGGYDVESNLVPGQAPFGGYPRAEGPSQVLYGVHNGAIPGVSGNPTNRGIDPYVATRGADGWSTAYVGIPANAPSSAPFSSSLGGADAGLGSFAFSGPEICNPCFGDGSQGIPVHNPDGTLTQGMAGSIPVSKPVSAGTVKKPFSDDGSHLVFGSKQAFEPGANNNNADVTIYSRNLKSGTTEIASTDASGNALADGSKVVELDVSANGSRVLIGDLVKTDTTGNPFYDLYMHIAGASHSIHLTPNVPDGAAYDGMTSDGTTVFFTTIDVPIGAADSDISADIFRADVGSSSATLSRVSTGTSGTGDTDACTPSSGWNSVSGGNNCDAVAIGGAGGVATGDGTIYFLSPELLDGPTHGAQGQANLYLVRPGSSPHFVATIDTTVGKPPLPAAFSGTFGAFNKAEALTVDQSTGNPTSGDVYVVDSNEGTVSRFKANGTPDNFTCGTCSGNTLPAPFGSFFFDGPSASEVAVDDSKGPSSGDIYVANFPGVDIFDSTGQYLSTLNGSGNNNGFFSEACGVAVDHETGSVYVGDYGNQVWRYTPSGAYPEESNYTGGLTLGGFGVPALNPCELAAGSGNVIFGDTYSSGEMWLAPTSELTLGFPRQISNPNKVSLNANAVSTNAVNGDFYVDEGTQLRQFNSSGKLLRTFGSADIAPLSRGVAINGNSGVVYASVGNHIAVFTPVPGPIDSPTVIHAVSDAGTRYTTDFQVTPDGSFGAFPSVQRLLPAVENEGHTEIYRYDPGQRLQCVSCSPTNGEVIGDSSLASDGLSLTDDGRVFFDSTDAIALLDANARRDVYEWEPPGTGNCVADNSDPNYFVFTGSCLSLISAGSSPHDSGLLSVSADGADAYFFTHDTLAHQDLNGPVTKIYDARVDGGFFDVPPPALCAASDECHGPGTQAAGRPPIGTTAGTPGSTARSSACKKGFVKRHGKCVKRPKHRKKHRRNHHSNRSHG
jgi:hypothetical protein